MSEGRAVTVLSGFLGSGKTTLLRRYLGERHPGEGDLCGRRAAVVGVIINELGAVGVDHHLLRLTKEQSVLLGGGCVCCTRRDDLVRTLRGWLDTEPSMALAMSQVIIETTGIADPVPVLFTLATDPVLKHHFAPPSVVVTLDAVNAAMQIERQPEVRKQIIAADRVVLTKTDLVPWDAVARCRTWVRQINPLARISVSRFGDGYDVLAPARRVGAVPEPTVAADPHSSVHSAVLGFSAGLDWPSFSLWLGMLLQARGEDVLRIKGMLDIGDKGPVLINVAQHVVHPPEHLPDWPEQDRRSFLVFITRDIDPLVLAHSLETFQHAGGHRDIVVQRLD